MQKEMLTPEQRRRYAPNLRLSDFTEEAQLRLLRSSLLIVGCGALGSTAAMYAAASGVGHITLVDFDTVEISNLQRQVFFREQDAGKSKAELIAASIRALNSDCTVTVIKEMFTEKNAVALTAGADFVIDAADNPLTTYLIERNCDEHGRAYVTAGIGGYKAQILTHTPGGIHFSDIFSQVKENPELLPCQTEGVFGPLAGAIASLEAAAAVRHLAGLPMPPALQTLDLRTAALTTLPL